MPPMITNLFGGMICVLAIVGVDILFGAHLITFLSRLVNHKVDFDSAVLKGLAGMRVQGEKEVVKIDEATLKGRLKIFLALMLLMPAAMLYFVVYLRK